jgi:hypothetical protein
MEISNHPVNYVGKLRPHADANGFRSSIASVVPPTAWYLNRVIGEQGKVSANHAAFNDAPPYLRYSQECCTSPLRHSWFGEEPVSSVVLNSTYSVGVLLSRTVLECPVLSQKNGHEVTPEGAKVMYRWKDHRGEEVATNDATRGVIGVGCEIHPIWVYIELHPLNRSSVD